MGVKGLTTFIEENQRRFLKKDKVHDCSLVIDGFGLVYHLYFGAELDVKHGGEFMALEEVTDHFFTNLKECGIQPYVLFDGPIDDDKFPTVLARLQDRIKDVPRILGGSTARLLPIFCVDLLLHYLWSHDIRHAVTLVEADCEIAALANHLNCPVLSEDSDYFIYNITNGYIPFRHFYWNNVWLDKSPRTKSIVCHKYHISRICDSYNVPENFLPYVSILLGNDWIEKYTFNNLVSSLPVGKQKQRRQMKSESRIVAIFHWLSQKSDREAGIVDRMVNSVPRNQRTDVKNQINVTLAMYLEEPDLAQTLKVLGVTKTTPDVWDDPQEEAKYLIRRRLVHPLTLNLLESLYVALPVVMSDPKEPSPHIPANEIRAALYRVALRRFRLKLSGAEFLFVKEYDKLSMSYKNSRSAGVFTSLCPMCDQHHSVEDGCKMVSFGGIVVQQFGFKTYDLLNKMLRLQPNRDLQVYIRNSIAAICPDVDAMFLEYLDVVLVSTLFWVKKTSPKPGFIHALLLSIVWSVNRCLCLKSTEELQQSSATTAQGGSERTSKKPTRHDVSSHVKTFGGSDPHGAGAPSSHGNASWNANYDPRAVGGSDRARGSYGGPSHVGDTHTRDKSSPKRSLSSIDIPKVPVNRFLGLFGDCRIRTASGAREIIHLVFDVALLHSASQWLCILNAAYLLHQVVDSPMSKFAMQEFFASNRLLHDVHARIDRLTQSAGNCVDDFNNLFEIISDRLESIPSMKILFQAFTEFVMQQ